MIEYDIDLSPQVMEREKAVLARTRPFLTQHRIGLIYGPVSSEDRPYYEAAVLKGPPPGFSFTAVAEATRKLGFTVELLDPRSRSFLAKLKTIDFAFVLIHGAWGEDGRLQGLLDYLSVPYLGSGVHASVIAHSKTLCKLVAQSIGMTVAPHVTLNPRIESEILRLLHKADLEYPGLLKPDYGGSSIGIMPCRSLEDARNSIHNGPLKEQYFLEKFVDGILVTVSAIQLGDKVYLSDVLEIEIGQGFYDASKKLSDNQSHPIQYHYPARIGEDIRAQIRKSSRDLLQQIGLTVFGRLDFIIGPDGTVTFLEINTLPGLGQHSNFIECMKGLGFSYDDTILALVRASLLNAFDTGHRWAG